MTLSALLLRQRFFSRNAPKGFMYATVGVLFVNISIGGTLTPYAAPPVLMVADKWGLDIVTMLKTLRLEGRHRRRSSTPRAATFAYRKYLREQPTISPALARLDVPRWVIAVHLAFSRQRRRLQSPRHRLHRAVPVLPRLHRSLQALPDAADAP